MVDLNAGSLAGAGLVAAVLFGFTGSAHCAAMCGPLVGLYSRELKDQPKWLIHRQHLLYNFGRALMYANIGVLLGETGHLVGLVPYLSGLLGILLGSLIVTLGAAFSGPGRVSDTINQAFALVIRRLGLGWEWYSGLARSFGIMGLGTIHAFLPCPLLYVMYMTAVATQSPIHGGLFLFAFGIGTIPTMWAVGAFAWRLSFPQRVGLRRLFGVVVVGWGAFLVVHGVHALMGM